MDAPAGVRQKIAPPARARGGRHVEERLFLRFPALLAVLGAAIWKLPRRSRLRQAILRLVVRRGIAASDRRDHEAAFLVYHPDCESSFPLAVLGEPGTRGRVERIRWEDRWRAEWGEFHYVPEEAIDLGDQLLIVGRLESTGVQSGTAVDTDWAVLLTISRGRAIREQVFFDRREAFAAAGALLPHP